MNRIDLEKHLTRLNIKFDKNQIDLLFKFMSYTLEANQKFNLTAIKEEDSFVEKMIFDSAIALYDTDLNNKKAIDIGTGAGFPGMVLKILQRDVDMTLLDSTSKKIEHLKQFANDHSFVMSFSTDRAEDYAKANREKYDYAFARAVAPLNILIELIVPLLKVGGTFIAMKGAGFEEEINSSSNAFKKLNCQISSIYETELPESKEKRAIIRITKIKETNKKYPRTFSDIKKMPL